MTVYPVTTKHKKLILRGSCFNDLWLFSREPVTLPRKSRITHLESVDARVGLSCLRVGRRPIGTHISEVLDLCGSQRWCTERSPVFPIIRTRGPFVWTKGPEKLQRIIEATKEYQAAPQGKPRRRRATRNK